MELYEFLFLGVAIPGFVWASVLMARVMQVPVLVVYQRSLEYIVFWITGGRYMPDWMNNNE